METNFEDVLNDDGLSSVMHYGTKRHSGRYPYGSGENPFQHDTKFISRVKTLESEGFTEKEIADCLGYSIAELRNKKSLAKTRTKQEMVGRAIALSEKGMPQTAIAEELGIPESTLRSLLKPSSVQKRESLLAAVDTIERNVNENNYIDISPGTASTMGISEYKFKVAVQDLKDRGYSEHYIRIPQHGNNGQMTTMKVLAKPGVTNKEVWQNRDKIAIINERFETPTGTTKLGLKPIKSISSDKVAIRYAEDGGENKDGVIELRRGAEGLSLGNARYAQVRIGVDGTHYLKGMAVYSDNLPAGVDILFNTNKHKGTPKMDVLKKMSDDGDNPFGSTIKPGGQRGYLNIVREEGDWATWAKTLSSQMLSKQSVKLARDQLGIALNDAKAEYKEIMSLTNPTVKRHLLTKFAESCDSDAVDLQAAALPRQSHNVILPLPSMKPSEIYAPGYKNGETVVLIRYPHGGTFEIPQLKVNNNNREAKKIFQGNSEAVGDFVGIHPDVAKRLSGADFDGDTVLVIPNNTKKIQTSPALKGLADFDPKASYPYYEGMKVISPTHKQRQMGVVSNLITDMTLQGASQDEIARAVRHSMVVIDSEKHKLNYQQSFKDNDIAGLQKKYQLHADGKGAGGASTLISRAGSERRVPQRAPGYKIDPSTGEKVYRETGKTYVDRETGKLVKKTSKTTAMAETKDARVLSSGTKMEAVYADYANGMKALANKARKDSLSVKDITYSPQAYQKYKGEVDSLNTKLKEAIAHTPYERKARILADTRVKAKIADDPSIKYDKDRLSKIQSQALAAARAEMGGKAPKVTFTDKEWEAVQAGAVRKTKLENLLVYADTDQVRNLAMPKSSKKLTASKIAQARARLKNGFTQEEVASMLGVSVSTLRNALSS